MYSAWLILEWDITHIHTTVPGAFCSISTNIPRNTEASENNLSLFLFILSLIVCGGVCTWVQMLTKTRGVKYPWSWSYRQSWVLGVKLAFLVRAVHVLDHWVITPVPQILIFKSCIAPAPIQHGTGVIITRFIALINSSLVRHSLLHWLQNFKVVISMLYVFWQNRISCREMCV